MKQLTESPELLRLPAGASGPHGPGWEMPRVVVTFPGHLLCAGRCRSQEKAAVPVPRMNEVLHEGAGM